ncbi:S8 family serine peptidase [Pyrococcus yayanosii]|uniref:Stetterlysin n=1 Tax=Pyrococcus yayanosii (strain CH1 / JCM 16557) TaxID=529709 RepID=F8AIW4_PYRYC|nr:S8 family serine peptidase [Pyrococcus yayanosii]AEH24439.1 stetterlysin [Pyrococcus yayanosii CH1]
MSKRALSVLVALLMLVSAVPLFTPAAANEQSFNVQESPADNILDLQIQRLKLSQEDTLRLIVAPKDGYEMEVYEALKKLGHVDPISKPEYKFIVVELPKDKLDALKSIPGIFRVWKDRIVKLPEPEKREEYLEKLAVNSEDMEKPSMFMSVYTIDAVKAWQDYGVYGDGVIVAVLDTGVDVAHPFLQIDLNGERKIIDIYDASDEGIVEIYYNTSTVTDGYITVNKIVQIDWGSYYLYYGHQTRYTEYTLTSYYVGNIPGNRYYIGLLPERYFDFNNFNAAPNDPYNLGLFGDLSDVYPVLIVNQSGNFIAYIDTDLDNNFTDETPMRLFDDTGDYIQFPETMVTVAFARFYPEDGYAIFMWDSHGHGTHVSGTIAGVGLSNDPVFNGVYGVAPNAKLIEVKVLPGEGGFGRTSWIINGMIYAAVYGPDEVPMSGDEADVISMSLGGLREYNDGLETPYSFYVNYLTDYYGVVFSIAAGNEGPTTNTVGAPADSDLAITVGNYWESERWELLYGFPGVVNGPAMSSSRGPRMDGLLDPDVIAPGTAIFSSLPMWYTVLYGDPYRYYGFWSGTSMATPHVSGAVALMISYAREKGIRYDPIMIKRALELTAKPVNGTLIDQGFGLIQVDKAIAKLEELSQEPTTYIYAGTTFTSFKDIMGEKEIPLSKYHVQLGSYFYNLGLPYLYRGVYIRNERPRVVPIYFYPMDYIPGHGLNLTKSVKGYRISTSVDWIIPNVTWVEAGGSTPGRFSIFIDYSKLQKSGTYVGLIYIDDPSTSYIDGYVAVTVDIPMNLNGESSAKLSDTGRPGEAKHYFFEVPRGTQELRITLRLKTDENGNPMGRTKLVIASPTGRVIYDGPYVGAIEETTEYTWVVRNPAEGVWEITAYTSVITKYYTGLDESYYEIEVQAYSVALKPELIKTDIKEPGTVEVPVEVMNFNGAPISVDIAGYGLNVADPEIMQLQITPDSPILQGPFQVNENDYYIEFGITSPEDPYNADLDLIVYYFPTLADLNNFLNGQEAEYTVYYDQVGPTNEEVFRMFKPAPGYYLVVIDPWYLAYPMEFTFYYRILSDNGDVVVNPTSVSLEQGESVTVTAEVTAPSEGTFLGIIGVSEAGTGTPLTYAPMIIQVGKPEMVAVLYGTPVLGEKSKMTLVLLDRATLEPVTGPTTVVINGETYYTENGRVDFYYTPTNLGAVTFDVQVISDEYKDVHRVITRTVAEPTAVRAAEGHIVLGAGQITSVDSAPGRITMTLNGETGEWSTVIITLPRGSRVTGVSGTNIVDYQVIYGSNNVYVIATVKFASTATVTVTYKTPEMVLQGMIQIWYMKYLAYSRRFNDLYEEAKALGVSEDILEQAVKYKAEAEQYFEEFMKYGSPYRAGIVGIKYIRKAYLSMREAIKILEQAIEEAKS